MNQSVVRVLIVEDHFLARLAVNTFLGSAADVEVVGEAESGWQAVAAYQRTRPDVVLMDIRLPEMDGIEATAMICREDPSARILILSHYESQEDVARALAAGARGYVRKDVDGATLVNAVQTVARGGTFLPAEIAERLKEREESSQLTRREIEILRLLGQAKSNPEIAAALSITEGTARIHVSNILTKLGAKRRTEAVTLAIKRGLLKAE